MTLDRKTPMKRTAFKTKPGAAFSSFANAKTALRRTEMKKRARKKPTVAEGSKYLEACRGEECYLRVPGVCCGDWETVVPCHDNRLSSGKGMGLKADHKNSLPGCWTCHRWLDQGQAPRAEKFETFDRGFSEWIPDRARKMGIETMEFEA